VTEDSDPYADFRGATAELVLGAQPQVVIDAAVRLLEIGVRSVALATLAGDDHADRFEIERDLRAVEAELGLTPWSLEAAADHLAQAATVAYLSGEIGSEALAYELYRACASSEDGSQERGRERFRLMYHAELRSESPEYVSEQELMDAARRFLAREPIDDNPLVGRTRRAGFLARFRRTR
jgi:hypothetical protein